MTVFIIIAVSLITAIIGWIGVQKTGNYENAFGYATMISVVVFSLSVAYKIFTFALMLL